MFNFNIHDWRFSNLLKEGKDEKPKFARFEHHVAALSKPGEKTEEEIRNYARVPFRKAIDAWEAGRPWKHFLPKTLPDFLSMWNTRNVKEAKKKDPVRRDTEEEREGLRQAGIRTTEKTFTDRKARQKRGYEKHKGVRYEEAVQEAVRKLEESRKQKQSS